MYYGSLYILQNSSANSISLVSWWQR